MAWALAALAGVQIATSLIGNRSAQKETQKRGAANAAALRAEANNKIRKTELSQGQDLSSTLASAGASGVSTQSKSVENYLAEMKSNFKKDIDWMKKARDSGVAINNQRTRDEVSGLKRQAWGTVLKGAGDIYSGMQAGKQPAKGGGK